MSMFTSCRWFFEDPSGLETRQVLRYAARAMELAAAMSDVRLEEDFLRRLDAVASNDPAVGSARRLYEEAKGSDSAHPEPVRSSGLS